MSTRCHIQVIGKLGEIKLYKHHDGNPKHMVPLLKSYLKDFDGFEAYANRLVKDQKEEFEVAGFEHGDVEYLYEVNPETKEVQVI